MKKLTSLLVVAVLALGMMAFAGCWFDAQSISFVEAPPTTFTLGENVLDFTIRVNENNTTMDYRYSDYKGLISVSGFNTDTVGSRRATVTYDGKFSLRFDYTVVNDKFAGGTGSEFDPYLVSTPVQFQNLLDSKTFKYYKLTNSIDFKNITLRMPNDGRHGNTVWAGVIDGAGYTLMNLDKCLSPDGYVMNKYCVLFGRIGSRDAGSFVMKNITVDYASSGDSALIGLAYGNGPGAEILFENVNFTGVMDAESCSDTGVSAAINIAGKTTTNFSDADFKSITFKNCTNDLHIINSYGNYSVAGYFGGNNGKFTGTVTFDNCSFNGTIDGASNSEGAFAAQAQNGNGTYEFINCTIGGDAKLYMTGSITVGEIAIHNYPGSKTDVESITSDSSLIETIPSLKINMQSNKKSFTVSNLPEGVDSYKVFVKGTLHQREGDGSIQGGDYRFAHPVILDEETGIFSLYKVVGSGDDFTNTTLYKGFASTRFVLNGNTVTYYYKGVGTGITVSNATVYVVAFNSQKVAIAYGTLVGFDLSE